MTFIKKVKTPTLVLVGELDGESPWAQSFQFWHALKERVLPHSLLFIRMKDTPFYGVNFVLKL
jgi:dipeptidyl aminopeptidase/acylaminoacyl peptidase